MAVASLQHSHSILQAKNTTGYVKLRKEQELFKDNDDHIDERVDDYYWYDPKTKDFRWRVHQLGPRLGELATDWFETKTSNERIEQQRKLDPIKGRAHHSRWMEYWYHSREVPNVHSF